MIKYLIHKNSKILICEITKENYQYNSDLYEIIETNSIPNFFKSKWNGTEWIESATPEEIAQLQTANLTNRIAKAFTCLRQRALASSIGKPLSLGYDYIKEQAEQYRYKYSVAKGNITDVFVSQMIANEALDFGIEPEQMRDLIIYKFEQGESAYLSFTAMIERARTKALTMLEIKDFGKAEAIIIIMENVPETLTMQDAEILTNQMLSI
jgi:hypothetical protein